MAERVGKIKQGETLGYFSLQSQVKKKDVPALFSPVGTQLNGVD